MLHSDWSGQPLLENRGFKMTHDLRRSVIAIEIATGAGAIRAELRAHKELDVIRIVLFDERTPPGDITIRVEVDFEPTVRLRVETRREIRVSVPDALSGLLKLLQNPCKSQVSGVGCQCSGTL